MTSEVQSTFQMYQNLYGNKVFDFNDDVSVFRSLNNILAGSDKHTMGTELINKSAKQGGKWRLCLISIIYGGERYLSEINYDAQGIISVD